MCGIANSQPTKRDREQTDDSVGGPWCGPFALRDVDFLIIHLTGWMFVHFSLFDPAPGLIWTHTPTTKRCGRVGFILH
jgi:hypothetical protein